MASRAQTLFWIELTELKAGYEYIHLYRDSLSSRLDYLTSARTVVSVAAFGGWFTRLGDIGPQVWAGIIVIVQVAEAVERGLRLSAKFAAASDLCAAFDTLFIEARQEREQIGAGKRTDDQTGKAWGKLMERRRQADHKAFPRGLPHMKKLKRLAKDEADAYFAGQFTEEEG